MTPILSKGLGRIADKPDARDSVLASSHLFSLGAPTTQSYDVFMSKYMPVFDQGSLGSCTANAGCLYRAYLAAKWPQYSKGQLQPLSRLFLYYQERKLDGDIAQDAGSQIRNIFKVLTNVGVCAELNDPYNVSNFAAPSNDTPTLLDMAADYKIGAYHRVPDVVTAKSVIVSDYPIALGFNVYESFESIGKDGLMQIPKANEQLLGGHAVVIRGFDDAKQSFLCQNSWGADWGFLGCFYAPYEFISNADLSQPDMWVGHLGPAWKAS